MMGYVCSICWMKDGWFFVMFECYGVVFKVVIIEEELFGNWEYIDFIYKYGEQRILVIMIFVVDYIIIEGIWKGSMWSYDVV